MCLSQEIFSKVLELAENAGLHLLDFYKSPLTIHQKANDTPVTNADLFVSQYLSEQLTFLTPDIPILSEESCNIPLSVCTQWQRYWLIDPLDGTQQFIDRTGHFCVIIALMCKEERGFRPHFGVIHAPLLNKTFFAIKDQGAYRKDRKGIHLLESQKLNLNEPIKITAGDLKAWKTLQPFLNPELTYEFIPYGSSGLKATLVADDYAHCYVRFGDTGEWDTAAAELILEEKGGGIFDFTGNPLIYNQRQSLVNPNFIMLGENSNLWQEILLPLDNMK